MAEIDHLVYAVPDLDEAIDRFERDLGVRPEIGGRHTGMGTWNALVALDFGEQPRCYLELIAPDPDQPDPAGPRPFGLDDDPGPRLTTFAVRPAPGETLDDLIVALRSAAHDPGPAIPMSRTTPDGVELHWHLTMPTGAHGGVVPFLIDWGDTPNPAGTVTASVQLDAVRCGSPGAGERALDALGISGLDRSLMHVEPLTAELRNGDRSLRL